MANKNEKNPDNVPGKYYVDDSCITCDSCTVEAKKIFAMNDSMGRAYVFHQPTTPEEIADAENARLVCPVEAIGNDG